jgi:hypothetical protein
MAEKDAPKPAGSKPEERRAERPEDNPVIPGYWGPNMLIYGDISRMLLRMHRNVAVHMDAHKRLMERLQAVFAHEQALVLELAKIVDDTMTQASGKPGDDRSAPGKENMQRVFDHAANAMQESGKMLTDIQLESLALLQHYVEDAGKDVAKSEEPEGKQKT